MKRTVLLGSTTTIVLFLFGFVFLSRQSIPEGNRAEVDTSEPRPIPIRTSLWMEELTWMEVRDLVQDGYATVILPTGGIEQNGPNVITGKHNKIVEVMAEAIAKKLGKALIAPVVKFVPEGNHNPPTGHMLYPGTLGLTEDTYRNVLRELCLSLKHDGFQTIVLLGDSGGNQGGMESVADNLNKEWPGESSPRVVYSKSYYFEDTWSYDYLKSIGVNQLPDIRSAERGNVHSDYHYEAILAAIDPNHIRAEERRKTGPFEINGVSLDPLETVITNGNLLIEYRASLAVDDIRNQQLEFASLR